MHKINQIELKLFEDDANGSFGLAHSNAINLETSFNAFWNGPLIFHDVFEHWFEDTHKYFKGKYAFNIGGEVAASGAFYYFYQILGLYNRMEFAHINMNFNTPKELTINNTMDQMIETCMYGYERFGSTLESSVSYQRPCYDEELEYGIDEHYRKVMKTKIGEKKRWVFNYCCKKI